MEPQPAGNLKAPVPFGGDSSGASTDEDTDVDLSCEVTEAACAAYYTVHGMCSFFKRPYLWKKIICPVLVTSLSTLVSLVALFVLTFKSQAELLVKWGWPEWLSSIGATFCVLVEVGLINLVILLVLFSSVQSEIFRAILAEKGILQEIAEERGGELPEQNCLRDVCHSLGFLVLRLPLMILTLPLCLVPAAGEIAFVFLNGWLYAWEMEAEFMVMLDQRLSCSRQWHFVKRRFCAFFSFGAAAMSLELIPFLGPWVFFATNACGAALLAERFYLEKKRAGEGTSVSSNA